MSIEDFIKSNLRVDEDGRLWWLSEGQGRNTSRPAGFRRQNGYMSVTICRRQYKAHRVVYLLSFGSWPDGEIDHIDRDKANNRPSNLRVVSRSENILNTGKRLGTKSKYRGVYWHAKRQKWRAMISANGRLASIGMFHSEEEAARAFDARALKERGEFAVLNFPRDSQ